MTLNDVGKQSEEIRNRYHDFRRALPRITNLKHQNQLNHTFIIKKGSRIIPASFIVSSLAFMHFLVIF